LITKKIETIKVAPKTNQERILPDARVSPTPKASLINFLNPASKW
jgi:hypothetical protein